MTRRGTHTEPPLTLGAVVARHARSRWSPSPEPPAALGTVPEPHDPATLEGNDHAVGYTGGGAPPLNMNAMKHGAWNDPLTENERLDGNDKRLVDSLADEAVNRSKTELPRDRLAMECHRYAALLYLATSSRGWAHAFEEDGIEVVRERTVGGVTVIELALHPAIEADRRTNAKLCTLERELRLHPSSNGRA